MDEARAGCGGAWGDCGRDPGTGELVVDEARAGCGGVRSRPRAESVADDGACPNLSVVNVDVKICLPGPEKGRKLL